MPERFKVALYKCSAFLPLQRVSNFVTFPTLSLSPKYRLVVDSRQPCADDAGLSGLSSTDGDGDGGGGGGLIQSADLSVSAHNACQGEVYT